MRPHTLSYRLMGACAMVALVLGVQVAAPSGADEPGRPDARPSPSFDDRGQVRPRSVVPKSTTGVSDPGVRAAVRSSMLSRTESLPSQRGSGGLVRVEVLGARVRSAVRRQGGTVVGAIRGLVLADVSARRMGAVEQTPGVTRVRLPLDLLGPGEVTTPGAASQVSLLLTARTQGQEPLVKTGASGLHARGITGAGVRVGILDGFDEMAWNAAAEAGELPLRPAGTFCLYGGVACNVWGAAQPHGVAVAEIVKDMAPSADIYIASVTTATDLKAAVDYFASQGVRVVNRSEAVPYDGAGDGTGPTDQVVAYAETRGITFVKSAGNTGTGAGSAGGYFRGMWADPDGDGYLDFAPGDELLDFDCGFVSGLRWSDWGAGRTDYDLYILDGPSVVGVGRLDQGAGADPIEFAYQAADPTQRWYCTPGRIYQLFVHRFAPGEGSAGDVLEFMVKSAGGVQYASNPGSAASPISDAANPGALSVGAVDPPIGADIAPYSSHGPTNDGRIKPDLSAPSNFSNASYGFFDGTSAATPVVTGGAALLLSVNPALTPAGLAAQLRMSVVDRGAPGPDNVFGTGELFFAAPPPPSLPAPAVITPPSAVRGLAMRGRPGAVRRVVVWRRPATTGGSSVIAYKVKVVKGRAKVLARVVVGSKNKMVLQGDRLPRGWLAVRVKAINTVGSGPPARRRFVVR